MDVATNGITLSVRVAGSGPAVVLAHGFPEIGYSWRHQVPALVEAGYRVIVPDMRGYGGSDQPTDVESYSAQNVGNDLIGLLDALGEQQAVFVGHDWGAGMVWPLGLSHPDRVRAVAGLSVPFGPPAPVAPTQIMRKRLGESFYMIQFQQQGPPEENLARDVRATMTAMMASISTAVGGTFEPAELPGWLTPDELDVYVRAFEQTGFAGGLNYYRNIDRNWEQSITMSKRTSEVPAMFLTGSLDPVRGFMPSDRLGEVFTNLQEPIVVEGAGHWVQQERAAEVNDALIAFLASLDRD
ncbi:epoxide hydrolase [Aeromicrobium sp. A1-2]|nr:epoxide hydrolase [Aeromicrobium sp. A1-2]